MVVVADTHAFVLALTRPRSLGRDAARIFRRAERGLDEVRVPTIVLFEVSLLLERGRIRQPLGWEEWLAALASAPGLVVEPLVMDDVAHAHDLVVLVDPFDRLIAATARRLDVPLVTADARITESRAVRVIW